MKSKTPLVIMEQIIMLLVFALAAALCLRAFALAHSISVESGLRSDAVNAAQNAAETLKHCGGDFAASAELLGAETTETGFCMELENGLVLSAEKTESELPLLGKAVIRVTDSEGTGLFTVEAAWQTGGGE